LRINRRTCCYGYCKRSRCSRAKVLSARCAAWNEVPEQALLQRLQARKRLLAGVVLLLSHLRDPASRFILVWDQYTH